MWRHGSITSSSEAWDLEIWESGNMGMRHSRPTCPLGSGLHPTAWTELSASPAVRRKVMWLIGWLAESCDIIRDHLILEPWGEALHILTDAGYQVGICTGCGTRGQLWQWLLRFASWLSTSYILHYLFGNPMADLLILKQRAWPTRMLFFLTIPKAQATYNSSMTLITTTLNTMLCHECRAIDIVQ